MRHQREAIVVGGDVARCGHTWKIQKSGAFKRIYDDNKNNRLTGREGEREAVVRCWMTGRTVTECLLPIKRPVERARFGWIDFRETILGLSLCW